MKMLNKTEQNSQKKIIKNTIVLKLVRRYIWIDVFITTQNIKKINHTGTIGLQRDSLIFNTLVNLNSTLI